MYTYELRAFNKNGKNCFRVDHIGSERDAMAKFHQYKDNTLKAHIALDNAGLPRDCLADMIDLVYRGSMACSADAFGFVSSWQLQRNSDGVIVENY